MKSIAVIILVSLTGFYQVSALFTFSETCNEASALAINDVVYSSTFNVVIDTSKNDLRRCGGSNTLFDLNNAGIFYSIVGTDALMRVSTCFDETDLNNRISVFTNCETQSSCVVSESSGHSGSAICSNSMGTVVEWQSIKGETYYIKVQNERAGESGNFGLQVQEVPPENDSCTAAIQLDEDDTLLGTSSGAIIEGTSTVPGVWYYIPPEEVNQVDDTIEDEEGDRKVVVVLACANEQLNLYAFNGTCNDLQSLESEKYENLDCGDGSLASAIYWNETKNETSDYYLFVTTDNTAGAQFRIGQARFLLNDNDGGGSSGVSICWNSFVRLMVVLILWFQS